MKTLKEHICESIFNDDDIVKDVNNAPSRILKELGLDSLISIKNNKIYIESQRVVGVRSAVDGISKNIDKFKKIADEIEYTYIFSDSMANDELFNHFKINKCKYLSINNPELHNFNIDKIDAIKVDIDLTRQDDYLYKVCELANKHGTYMVYFDTSFADAPINFIIHSLKELRKCKSVKYIIYNYTGKIYDFIKLKTKNITEYPELMNELDAIYANGEKRNIYFVDAFSTTDKSIDACRFEPTMNSYNIKYLTINAFNELKRQLK